MADALPLVAANGKALALRILDATMAAIDVRHAMLARIGLEGQTLVAGSESIDLAKPPRLIAVGKAANRMAATLDEVLGGRIESGLVVSPSVPPQILSHFRYFQGGHPYPNAGSLGGAEAAIELLTGLTESDTVIYLISGGGSALFEKPFDPQITLSDLIELNRLLVGCGLPIEQINVIRKHLSSVKGGRLAARAYPARQLTIYISDVPDNMPSMVASGPTMPDKSTAEQCYTLVKKHALTPKLPASIRKHFEAHSLEETPKPGDPRFARSRYYRLLSNQDALEAAKTAAEDLGFAAEIDVGNWDAHYRQVVDESMDRLDAARKRNPGKAFCLIQGGEVISPVMGNGMAVATRPLRFMRPTRSPRRSAPCSVPEPTAATATAPRAEPWLTARPWRARATWALMRRNISRPAIPITSSPPLGIPLKRATPTTMFETCGIGWTLSEQQGKRQRS